MTEEKTCQRCGSCCMVLPLFTQHMHPEFKKYLLNRGLVEDKEQGCILIPHVCQHLKHIVVDSINTQFMIPCQKTMFSCDIHDSEERPHICRAFHGQKFLKGARIYIPPSCAFAKEKP